MTKNQTKYVDGFVLVVPKKKLAEYRKMAQWGKKLWLKYGALDYKECVGDDLRPKGPPKQVDPHPSYNQLATGAGG